MTTLREIADLGIELGFEGASLQNFIKEYLDSERNERAQRREVEKEKFKMVCRHD